MKITFKRLPNTTRDNGAITKSWQVQTEKGFPIKNQVDELLIISSYSHWDYSHNYSGDDDLYATFAQVKSAVIAQLESNNKEK